MDLKKKTSTETFLTSASESDKPLGPLKAQTSQAMLSPHSVDETGMDDYWNKRFAREGMIWGTEPSPTARMAKEWFTERGCKSVLVPGGGYGRNTKAFSGVMDTDAVEASPQAAALGREWDSRTRFIEGSVLQMPEGVRTYDGIYAYGLLHLFTEDDRLLLVRNLMGLLNPGGTLVTVCFSDEDGDYGQGTEIEPGTYEVKPGKIVHFFSDEDFREHFRELNVRETFSVEEELRYAEGGGRQYRMRVLRAEKDAGNRGF